MLLIDASRQSAFATLSGDYNPLHVDADQARRSQFGSCVVHGVHLVLAALDSLKLDSPFTVVRLDAQFRSAVMLGETVSCTHELLADGSLRIAVTVGGQVRTSITLEVEHISSIGAVSERTEWPTDVSVRLDLEQLVSFSGRDQLAIAEDAFAVLFPSLATTLRRTDAAALLATTRVVGMQCPGQWALFRRLIWQRSRGVDGASTPAEVIGYHVSGVDKRFDMLTLELNVECLAIRAEVILREAPPTQIDLSVVRSRVRPDEFKGVRALIVGGSRGLGELTAKLLAAGGADVLISYRTGAEDAVRVAGGLGNGARTVQFDVGAPDPAALGQIVAFAPTHISYFATPVIAKRPPYSWDPTTFLRFIDIYVLGLSQLLSIAHSAGSLESLFFPSSTFIDEAPVGFAEYIAAKTAGEALCAAWQLVHPVQRVVIERLPPLVTDQTAARLGTDTIGNLDVMLPVLRRIMC
ncbi:MAG: SDR family NAD(P)-dependent oxidoreductase [Actinomycetes bacterium]